MKKKVVACLLASLMAAGTLAGCGSSSSSSSSSDTSDSTASTTDTASADTGSSESSSGDEIVLTFPTYWCGENVGAVYFEPAVERFNEQYDGQYEIQIEEVVEDTFNDKMSQLAQSGNLPALIGGFSSDFVENIIIPNNLYTPMNDFLDENPDIKALCLDSSLEYCTQENGDIVSVPIVSVSNMGTFYNTELYTPDKNIVDMTVDEFVESLGENKIAFQTADNAWTSMLFLTALVANEDGGAEWLQESDGTKVTDFNQDFIINAMDKLKEIWTDHAASNSVGAAYADAANAFMSKQAAVICNGSWMNSEFTTGSEGDWSNDFDGADVKADYYPGNIAIATTKSYGRYLLTNGGTAEEQECAQAFLKFIYSQDELETFALTEGCQIPNMEYSDEFLSELEENPLVNAQTTLVTDETTMVPSLSNIMYDSVAGDVFANDLVQFINGSITSEEFAADLTQKSEEAADE